MSNQKVPVLNFLCDLASPHNNVLLKAVIESGVKVNTWYAYESRPGRVGGKCFAHDLGQSTIFGGNHVNLNVIWYALTHPSEKFQLVGWSNPTSRWLIVLFCLLGRDFAYFTDHPVPNKKRSFFVNTLHRLFLYFMGKRARPFFVVGKHTIDYFVKLGIPQAHLVSLPIFVEVSKTKEDLQVEASLMRKRYSVSSDQLFLSSGSRFIFDKGFDVLVEAMAIVNKASPNKVRLLIIGEGPEEARLTSLITQHELEDTVFIERWLSPEDFTAVIAASDVYIHPARFDAYGGGTLHAMALGISVIGSRTAGSAFDRVEHGLNGYLYNDNSALELAKCIEKFVEDPKLSSELGEKARETAEKWQPHTGAELVKKHVFANAYAA